MWCCLPGSDYLIVPFSTDEKAADQIGFTIMVEQGGDETTVARKNLYVQPSEFVEKNDTTLALEKSRSEVVERLNAQIRLDARFRETRQRIASERLLKPVPESRTEVSKKALEGSCTLSSECEQDALCVDGECLKDVPVLSNTPIDDFQTVETFTAYVGYKGERCAVLVDQSNGTHVTEDSVNNMGEIFDALIFPRLQSMYGEAELQDGTKAWDRNGDGLVWFALTSQFPTNVAGYFDPGDFVDNEYSQYSNEADILFLQPPGRMIPMDSIFGTLAHEFQHLLNFSAKYYLPAIQGLDPAQEELWLDEGLAHFTEEAVGYGVDTLGVLYSMLEDFGEHRLVETRSGASYDTIGLRAMAYLFVRYTVESLGGLEYPADGKHFRGTGCDVFTVAAFFFEGGNRKLSVCVWERVVRSPSRGARRYRYGRTCERSGVRIRRVARRSRYRRIYRGLHALRPRPGGLWRYVVFCWSQRTDSRTWGNFLVDSQLFGYLFSVEQPRPDRQRHRFNRRKEFRLFDYPTVSGGYHACLARPGDGVKLVRNCICRRNPY